MDCFSTAGSLHTNLLVQRLFLTVKMTKGTTRASNGKREEKNNNHTSRNSNMFLRLVWYFFAIRSTDRCCNVLSIMEDGEVLTLYFPLIYNLSKKSLVSLYWYKTSARAPVSKFCCTHQGCSILTNNKITIYFSENSIFDFDLFLG